MLNLMDQDGITFLNWRRLYDPDLPWKGIDVSAEKVSPPLYYAAQAGLKELVALLLEAGSKPNDGRGLLGTALQVAAYNGHQGVAEKLLSAGGLANGNASIDSDSFTNRECGIFITPLKAAAAARHTNIVKLLLENGADPDITDRTSGTAITGNRKAATICGTNPLEIASNNGALDIVSQLLPKASKETIAIGLIAAAWTKSRTMLELYVKHDPDAVLHHAAGLGRGDMVTFLLQKGAATTTTLNLHYVDQESPVSALREAAAGGHELIVQELIASGANVNSHSGRYRNFPLESAVAKGLGSIVTLLLAHGAEVDACGPDGTALQLACYDGCMATVKALLDHGADPNLADGSYGGPLQAAVIGDHPELVQFLLDSGANVNLGPGKRSRFWGIEVSSSSLAAASRRGNDGLVDFLLSKRASVHIHSQEYPSALQVAAAAGHTPVIKRLLTAGADVEAGYEHDTPLHFALQKGRLAAVKELLTAGANANTRGSEYQHSITPLYRAIEDNDVAMLKLLIHHGADVNAWSDTYGRSHEPPLHTAAEKGCLNLVNVLLENGADLNWQTEDGWTASHLAARGHPDILRLFFSTYQADLSLRLINGSLPLHSAASGGNTECIETLLAVGVDIDALNKFARTPLHFAAEKGHPDAAQLLVNRGAKVDIKEEETQMTPLDYAKMEAAKAPADANRRRCVDI